MAKIFFWWQFLAIGYGVLIIIIMPMLVNALINTHDHTPFLFQLNLVTLLQGVKWIWPQ